MELVIVVYKQRDQIDFIGKTVTKKRNGGKLIRYSPISKKIYKSATQKRKEEIQLDTGDFELVFKETE